MKCSYQTKEMIKMTVGKVIRKCRKIRKMSLTELGKAAGFTKGADVRISQYQADRAVPTTAIKKRLASALGISKYALSRRRLQAT